MIVQEKFKDLEFDPVPHAYKAKGKDLTSTTKYIEKFSEPFPSNQASMNKAKKQLTDAGIDLSDGNLKLRQAQILNQWENTKVNAGKKGTKVHDFAEEYIVAKYTNNTTLSRLPELLQELAVIEFVNWAYNNSYELVEVECKMYLIELGIAGTTDLILKNSNTGKYIIADYKGLPLDTPILTPQGFKTIETLTKKDQVYDKDGEICNIKNISEVHYNPCYKITFDNNESIIADHEHRWLIQTGSITQSPKDVIMTTEEISNHLEKYTKDGQISSHKTLRILNAKPLKNNYKYLPIDPYVLGMWLGDGHSASGMITQINPLVWKEIEKRGYILGKDVSQDSADEIQTRCVLGIYSILKTLNLLNNKHIPDMYLNASYEQRLDLLKGLMDADGYYDANHKRFVMNTTRKFQAEWIVKIASTLGIKVSVLETYAKCNNKTFDCWNATFTSDTINPFLCKNQDINIEINNQHKYRKIVSCTRTDTVPTKCIEVDSSTHTFLAGESLIVTHNTNKDIFKNYGKRLLPPFNNLIACPYNKYQLQLSIYQIMLESISRHEKEYEVEERWLIWLKPEDYNKEQAFDYLVEPDIKGKLYEIFKLKDYSKELLKEYGHN